MVFPNLQRPSLGTKPDLPELEYGDKKAYRNACSMIDTIFTSSLSDTRRLYELGSAIRIRFNELEPLLDRYTSGICAACHTGCCVNRHGFPDFEDLLVFKSLGLERVEFDSTLSEHGLCQFLGEKGCMLSRVQRSYRCTWFFCDDLLDRFELKHPRAFLDFCHRCGTLSRARNELLSWFRSLLAGKTGNL